MKSEEWIIGAGAAVFIGLGVVTLIGDDIWEDEYHDAPEILVGTLTPHRDGREKIACASCHVIKVSNAPGAPLPPPPIAANAKTPPNHNDGRHQLPCGNCHVIKPAN
jgi:hypothetical protein